MYANVFVFHLKPTCAGEESKGRTVRKGRAHAYRSHDRDIHEGTGEFDYRMHREIAEGMRRLLQRGAHHIHWRRVRACLGLPRCDFLFLICFFRYEFLKLGLNNFRSSKVLNYVKKSRRKSDADIGSKIKRAKLTDSSQDKTRINALKSAVLKSTVFVENPLL
jgi:hypothetical protein